MTSNILALDQIINLFFDHFWIGAEHVNIGYNIGGELDDFVRFLGLHHFDGLSLNDVDPLTVDLGSLLLLMSCGLYALFLDLLDWDENVTDGV